MLARKMPRGSPAIRSPRESLQVRLEEHLGNVREMYARVIHARKPMYYIPLSDGDRRTIAGRPLDLDLPPRASNLSALSGRSARRSWLPCWHAPN